MAHAFDTGAGMNARTLLRTAIATRVAQLSRVNGRYLAAVVELPVPFRDEESLLRMMADYVQGSSPTAMVALGSGEFKSGGAGYEDEWVEIVDVHVYVLSSHATSTLIRQTGDAYSLGDLTADPGLETMLEHVRERLAGFTPTPAGLKSNSLRPLAQDAIYFGESYTIWEQTYEVQMRADVDRLRGLTQKLLGVDGTHGEDDANPGADRPTLSTETDIAP